MKREKNVFTGHTSHVSSLAFSPTGEILASGGVDTTVRLWDVRTGELVRTLVGHTDRVMYLAYSPDGKTLASVVGFEIVRSVYGMCKQDNSCKRLLNVQVKPAVLLTPLIADTCQWVARLQDSFLGCRYR